MKTFLILVCLTSAAISLTNEKEEMTFETTATEPRSKFAMLDDVRILANGLLQLGHGLKDFVHKTKVQINDIFQKLNLFDKSFFVLSEQTNEIKEEEEELKETTSKLQANNEELKNMSLQINSKLETLLRDKIQLQTKVGGLEDKLTQLVQVQPEMQELKEVSSLKNFVEQQDKNIKQLLNIVQEQHTQLNQQNNQIRHLEEKLSSTGFQESMKNSLTIRHTGQFTMASPSNNNETAETPEQNDSPMDCNDVYNEGHRSSGIYSIRPNGSEAFNVLCEMTSDGAWTVIQRRTDGLLDFNQTWTRYEDGFGDLHGDFWLGLNKVFSISRQAEYTLRIEMEDWKNSKRYIEYMFTLGSRDTDYSLRLFETSGNIPNALPAKQYIRFATADHGSSSQDQACPDGYSGGWWHTLCGGTNLNSKYIKPKLKGKFERRRGVYWKPDKGRLYSLRSTKMMIQPVDLENFY